jgi:hypothetical protein
MLELGLKGGEIIISGSNSLKWELQLLKDQKCVIYRHRVDKNFGEICSEMMAEHSL